MFAQRNAGFTLIEMMITVAIAAFLLGLAVPAFREGMSNAAIRSAAEALQNSIRSAQAEAIKRNRVVVLGRTSDAPSLTATPATTGTNWFMRSIAQATAGETTGVDLGGDTVVGNRGVSITGPTLTCFTPLGRLLNATVMSGADCSFPADASTPLQYDLSKAGGATLRVEVFAGGRVRMCFTAKTLSATTPDGCT